MGQAGFHPPIPKRTVNIQELMDSITFDMDETFLAGLNGLLAVVHDDDDDEDVGEPDFTGKF